MGTFAMKSRLSRVPKIGSRNRAFSLIELMVAMAIFLLVGSSLFVLFSHQQTNANQQQGLVGLNIGIRNAIGQLQLDLANAGTGYYVGVNIPSYPVGVTIANNVPASGTSCYDVGTSTYTAKCFDQLNILTAANSTTPPYPVNATNQNGGTSGTANCSDTSTGVAYGQAAAGLTLAQTAANYKQGDQLLLFNSQGSSPLLGTSSGRLMTAVILTQPPTVVGPAIVFTFNPTNADGTNTGPNWQTNDPLDIAACSGGPCPSLNSFGNQFCGTAWILKLNPISYFVDISNPNDPQLIRKQAGVSAVVMDQVIGFKVGATIWNSKQDSREAKYQYDSSAYTVSNTGDSAYMFSLVRSVRASLIGRTQPSSDPSFTFRNAFDGGPYQVQGASVVVNPRNLSMND
jgi:prepilin-type N-terminal cleavage/methylation domain-containing protein